MRLPQENAGGKIGCVRGCCRASSSTVSASCRCLPACSNGRRGAWLTAAATLTWQTSGRTGGLRRSLGSWWKRGGGWTHSRLPARARSTTRRQARTHTRVAGQPLATVASVSARRFVPALTFADPSPAAGLRCERTRLTVRPAGLCEADTLAVLEDSRASQAALQSGAATGAPAAARLENSCPNSTPDRTVSPGTASGAGLTATAAPAAVPEAKVTVGVRSGCVEGGTDSAARAHTASPAAASAPARCWEVEQETDSDDEGAGGCSDSDGSASVQEQPGEEDVLVALD